MNLEMSIRRSRLELHADILAAIQGGVNKPTRIMYNTGLAWMSLTQLLQSLEDQGLVEVSFSSGSDKNGRKTYSVTEKGSRFLAYFNKVKDLMESDISSSIVNVENSG
jgi:predicted transcriptional regulator